jgi:class 3 adenylate cyclase
MVDPLLPTGTVTLLLADVEGSTQLWQSQPEAMTAAIAQAWTEGAALSTEEAVAYALRDRG